MGIVKYKVLIVDDEADIDSCTISYFVIWKRS